MVTMKILGGLYLLWLGYKALKSAATARNVHATTIQLKSNSAYFKRGVTVQMTNPKAALAVLAIVSIGAQTGAPI